MKELKKMLNIIERSETRNYKISRHLFEYLSKNKASVISKETFGKDINILDSKAWTTYEHCVNMVFCIDDKSDSLGCHVTLRDGDSFHGHPTIIRFRAVLLIDINFISIIKSDIECDFKQYCSDKYDQYLEGQKNDWISNFKSNILS